MFLPMPASSWSESWVSARSLAGIVISDPPWRGCFCDVNIVCFHVEISVPGRFLVQRISTERGVYEWL
jgi:hypothetical protein